MCGEGEATLACRHVEYWVKQFVWDGSPLLPALIAVVQEVRPVHQRLVDRDLLIPDTVRRPVTSLNIARADTHMSGIVHRRVEAATP